MIYRVLDDISYQGSVIPRGALHALAGVSSGCIEQFLARGVIAPISAPPLKALPGWEHRARRLKVLNIEDALQLLEADAEALARAIRLRAETIREWQEEVKAFLTV